MSTGSGASDSAPSRWKLIAAFVAVYIIWGSTYLAIRFAIETLPGFLMAGLRFLIAGGVLYAFARLRGAERPTAAQWKQAGLIGAMMLLVGNGSVVFAEHQVPSGLVALLIASEPLMVALLSRLWMGGNRPGGRGLAGLIAGFVGVALLIGPDWLNGGSMHPAYIGLVMLASFSWAAGSLYGTKITGPKSPLLFAGMQMLAGGVFLTTLGTATGDWAKLSIDAISLRSSLALLYLIIGGSLMGYTAYSWLLKATTPARASTYAYVNPVVAVFLGWAFGGESLTMSTIIAAPVIIASVVLITLPERRAVAPAAASTVMPAPPPAVPVTVASTGAATASLTPTANGLETSPAS